VHNAQVPHLSIQSSGFEYAHTGSDEVTPRVTRESDKDMDLSADSFSSSHGPLEFEQKAHSVSFERLEETTFYASRGGGESEFSGPPPKQIDIEGGDSLSSDFDSTERPREREPTVKGVLLELDDGTAFDASRGESLFTPSDLPIFEDSPVFFVSTSSEFEQKTKKKVVVFDPRVVPSPKKKVDTAQRTVRCVFFVAASRFSKAFAVWKLQVQKRRKKSEEKRQEDSAKALESFGVSNEKCPPVGKGKAAQLQLRELREKHELISQIDSQREINERLVVRLKQMRRETATAQNLGQTTLRNSRESGVFTGSRPRFGF
jgi:hypothetical protein